MSLMCRPQSEGMADHCAEASGVSHEPNSSDDPAHIHLSCKDTARIIPRPRRCLNRRDLRQITQAYSMLQGPRSRCAAVDAVYEELKLGLRVFIHLEVRAPSA